MSNFTIDEVYLNPSDLTEAIRKSFTRDPFDHYLSGICGLFICLLGTWSNALSFSVLVRRTMQLSTYVYLAGLCLSDFTACLFLIPGYILDAYPMRVLDYELPRTYAYTRFLLIAGAISTSARVLSVWLCVAFTIDRWISRRQSNGLVFPRYVRCVSSDLSSIRRSVVLYDEECSICDINHLHVWSLLRHSIDVRIRATRRSDTHCPSLSGSKHQILSSQTQSTRQEFRLSLDLCSDQCLGCLHHSLDHHCHLESETPHLHSIVGTTFSGIQRAVAHQTRFVVHYRNEIDVKSVLV